MTSPATHPRRRTAHAVLTAVGGLGIAALFLPFSYGDTPLVAINDWGLWQLALPALIPLFVLPATARWLRSGSVPRLVGVLLYTLAAVTALDTLSLYRDLFNSAPSTAQEWLLLVGPLAILASGAIILRRVLRAGASAAFAPILALQVGYLAHALLASVEQYPAWQLGAYCILATMGAYALQIDLVRHAPAEGAQSS